MPHTSPIQLVAVDIDGTLMTDAKDVSPFTAREVRRVGTERLASVVLMSSRMPTAIDPLREALVAAAYYSAYSGALTCRVVGDEHERLFERVLDRDLVGTAISVASELALNIGVFIDRQWWTSTLDQWALREVRDTGVWPEPDDLQELAKDGRFDRVHKLDLRGEAGKIATAVRAIREGFAKRVDINDADANMAELTPADAGKLNSLKVICEHAGIPLDNVLAIGDGGVDVEMIRAAGWGVAVGNATPEAQEAADEVTLSNNDDGVGLILRKHFPTNEQTSKFSDTF